MALIISAKIAAKLSEKHGVSTEEIEQCFATREGKYIRDTREEHRTDPPTLWFISETYYGRMLKVVFVKVDSDIYIKTAYLPNDAEIRIYERKGK